MNSGTRFLEVLILVFGTLAALSSAFAGQVLLSVAWAFVASSSLCRLTRGRDVFYYTYQSVGWLLVAVGNFMTGNMVFASVAFALWVVHTFEGLGAFD